MLKKLSTRLSIVTIFITAVLLALFTLHLVKIQTNNLNKMIQEKGIAVAETGAKTMAIMLENIIDNEIFTIDELFDQRLEKIQLPDKYISSYKNIEPAKLTSIQKYHYITGLDSYLDNAIIEIQDKFLRDPQIEYAVIVDRNGYLPAHNSKYSKRLTGNFIFDRNNNRTKRIFRDQVSFYITRNTNKPYLEQIYHRDTGETLWDISSPVFIRGRHWGAFRIGLSMKKTHLAIEDLRNKFLIAMLILLALTAVINYLFTERMMKPLQDLHHGVERIARGDLSHKQNIVSNDEVGALASAFNNMVIDLQNHIDQLKTTTAEKERMSVELRVASDIQHNMLPKIFPPFPEKKDKFDIYAFVEPAKEVGGDFYDFMLNVKDGLLCFTVGDVSGKGVPASLFMAVTLTLLKSTSTKMENSPTKQKPLA